MIFCKKFKKYEESTVKCLKNLVTFLAQLFMTFQVRKFKNFVSKIYRKFKENFEKYLFMLK